MESAKLEEILALPIQQTETLRKAADEAGSFRQECAELKRRAERLGGLLRSVARVCTDGSGGFYRRPTKRIMEELEKSLDKALVLVKKCTRNGVIKRVITITSVNDFKRVIAHLDNAIGDIKWLLSVSASGEGREDHLGLPNIAMMDPMLAFVWEQISLLQRGTDEERADAATALATMAKEDRNGKMIVEEEGVAPMLKLLLEGNLVAREAAARALGYLAREEDRVKKMVADGVAPAFVKVLTDAPMKIQVRVAWALAEMVPKYQDAQDIFLQHGIIRPLVSLLSFETLEEPQNSKAVNMHSLVTTSIAASKAGVLRHGMPEEDETKIVNGVNKPQAKMNSEDLINRQENFGKPLPLTTKPGKMLGKAAVGDLRTSYTGSKHLTSGAVENGRGLIQYRKDREKEDPQLKEELKAEVARALWKLAEGNSKTSKTITETRALLCLAKLMEIGKGVLQFNCVMAVMEIAAVAERDADLRRAAFKTSSAAAKAVVDQLLRLVECRESDLQVPCIRALGCLSHTFPARETRAVKPLVMLLEGREDVATEAVIALVKFASSENYLHMEHSKAIVEASGAPHLVQLIYFGEGQAQISALILMCYLAMNVGESEALARADALPALERVAKHSPMMQDSTVQKLLPQAISRLEIYQGKGSRHHSETFHHPHF